VYENWLKSGDVITGLEQKIETLLEENRQRAALELDATGTIKALKAEVNCLKSDTVKTMTLCDCKKFYRLPSEKLCDKCTIESHKKEITLLKTVTDLIADGGVDALIEDNRKLKAALGHADAALANWENKKC
jgi:hypothetical protein